MTAQTMAAGLRRIFSPRPAHSPTDIDVKERYDFNVLKVSRDHQTANLLKQAFSGVGMPDVKREQLHAAVDRIFGDEAPIAAGAAEALPIPTEKYVGNRGGGSKGETVVDFLRRVWGGHIAAGLSRPELRRYDPKADEAITNWRRHSDWPTDLPIRSRSEAKTARDEQIAADPSSADRLRQVRRESKRLARAIGKFG